MSRYELLRDLVTEKRRGREADPRWRSSPQMPRHEFKVPELIAG
jgi:hypothetical protein